MTSRETNHGPTFTWLGHAAVRCDLPSGEVVLIDPFLSGNPVCPPGGAEFDRLDLILVSHAHGDHMADVVPLAKRHGALVIASYDLCEWFATQGVERLSGMNLGGTQTAVGCAVTQVRARSRRETPIPMKMTFAVHAAIRGGRRSARANASAT